jgi:isocitrate/isopropylmalate dehydrogenase
MFEPVHGSAPIIAGKNVSNPMGAILTAALMLDHLGFSRQSRQVETAVRTAVLKKQTTSDVGGSLGTREVGDWIANHISDG